MTFSPGEAGAGPGGPHGTQGHGVARGTSGCCLPCLVCPHVEGSWVTATDEENSDPKSLVFA